ncbi:MAG: oligosaccharide flippase family protein [Geminicoccaceae bacterium]
MSVTLETPPPWTRFLPVRLRAPLVEAMLPQALGALLLRAIAAGLLLLTTTLLARELGPDGLGAFASTMAFVTLASLPLSLGIPQGIVRIVHASAAHGDRSAIAAAVRWALRTGALASIAGALVLTGFSAWRNRPASPLPFSAIAAGLCLPPLVIAMCASGILRAFDTPLRALLPDLAGRGGAMALALFLLLSFGVRFDAGTALFLQSASILAGCLFALALVRRSLPDLPRPARLDAGGRERLSVCWPLMAAGIAATIMAQADVLMLAFLRGEEAAGLYRAASLASLATTVTLAAFLHPLAPKMAALFAQGRHARLQRLVSLVTLATTASSVPFALLLLLWPEAILTSVFGHGFDVGAGALAILVTGQLFNLLCGPVAVLLQYSGAERVVARTFAWCTAANLLLNAALIPPFGMEGAAVATALSLVAWNLHLTVFAQKRRDLSTSILACGRFFVGKPSPEAAA